MEILFVKDPPIMDVAPFKLVRRSICPCGHPTVENFVPDGKIYFIELWTICPCTMTCGGCKKDHTVHVGLVIEDGKRTGKMVLEGMEQMPIQSTAASVA